MRIALISYEHPEEIAGGGIGTYIHQIAYSLDCVGVEVEVFAGSINRSYTKQTDGYTVHFIQEPERLNFYVSVLEKFSERHTLNPFDLAEAPEHSADALFIKKQFPSLPLVIKLHTPTWLIDEINEKPSLTDKIRFLTGGLLRGKLVKPYWKYKKEQDPEYQLTCKAEAVYSPSRSLADIVEKKWQIKKPSTIPNPYNISGEILAIPIQETGNDRIVITFLGRLEVRKGVLILARAIPLVLAKHPEAIFRFIGKPHPSPSRKSFVTMDDYIKNMLGDLQANVEFTGFQPPEKIPSLLATSHICVFPSIWENFPNVCLEAMAAGRAVIASNSGGMSDMIDDGKDGILVSPQSHEKLASEIVRLIENKEDIVRMGRNARDKVLKHYNSTRIGELTKEFYLSTLAR